MRRLALLLATASLVAPLVARSQGEGRTGDEALLRRFAPLVLLAPGERALPANVDWFLARARIEAQPRQEARMTQASLVGAWTVDTPMPRRRAAPRLAPAREARAGSAEPRDWVTYAHVYAAEGGGTVLQYWFFYPFNDGRWLFDHEGDWEHVSVLVGADGSPRGAWYARHGDCAPGRWFAWDALARSGDHPIVLSARGTHASYAEPREAPWYDATCRTRDPATAAAQGCRPWRTWEGGGVLDTGTRERPRPGAQFIAWPGEWGARVSMDRAGGGPPGPAFQGGWCAKGERTCR